MIFFIEYVSVSPSFLFYPSPSPLVRCLPNGKLWQGSHKLMVVIETQHRLSALKGFSFNPCNRAVVGSVTDEAKRLLISWLVSGSAGAIRCLLLPLWFLPITPRPWQEPAWPLSSSPGSTN